MKRFGTIYTYSIVHSAAEEFKDRTPYVVALVDEKGQPRAASLLADYDGKQKIEIGMMVEYVGTDEAGNPVYTLS